MLELFYRAAKLWINHLLMNLLFKSNLGHILSYIPANKGQSQGITQNSNILWHTLKNTHADDPGPGLFRWPCARCSHCELVGMASLLLETESEALFSLKSRKPDPKSQTSIRKA